MICCGRIIRRLRGLARPGFVRMQEGSRWGLCAIIGGLCIWLRQKEGGIWRAGRRDRLSMCHLGSYDGILRPFCVLDVIGEYYKLL